MTYVRKEVIGNATLYLGDCLEVMGEMEDKFVNATVTDPPYGVQLTGKTQLLGGKKNKKNTTTIVYADNINKIKTLVRLASREVIRVSERAAVFTGYRVFHEYPPPQSVGCVFEPAAAGRDPWGFTCANIIFYYGKDPYLQRGMG